MRTNKSRGSLFAAAIAAVALLSIGAGSALASTTLSPAGDTFSLGSKNVTLVDSGFLSESTCTMNGGTVAIPAAPGNHSSGQLSVNFTTRPSFSNCMWGGFSPMTVSTSGTWSLKLQYGATITAAIAAPAGGLTVKIPQLLCEGSSHEAGSLTGTWSNGTLVPSLVNSTMTIGGGGITVSFESSRCNGTNNDTIHVATPVFTATDTTHPANIITVGS